jgi:hypothetical protein
VLCCSSVFLRLCVFAPLRWIPYFQVGHGSAARFKKRSAGAPPGSFCDLERAGIDGREIEDRRPRIDDHELERRGPLATMRTAPDAARLLTTTEREIAATSITTGACHGSAPRPRGVATSW